MGSNARYVAVVCDRCGDLWRATAPFAAGLDRAQMEAELRADGWTVEAAADPVGVGHFGSSTGVHVCPKCSR